MPPRRFGIMGGSFDPIHIGHLVMAEDAREAFQLDEVIWVPAYVSPHKQGRAGAAPDHRLAMIERAIEGHPAFRVSDIEIRRACVSYTIDTVRALREAQPDVSWHFILGADSLRELRAWKEIGPLLEECRFITVARPGAGLEALRPEDLGLPTEVATRLLRDVIRGHLVDISSSEIRQRVRTGKSVRFLVPPGVADYIRSRKLYATEE